MGLRVFKTVVGYSKYLTRTMMSSGFCNYHMMYYFSFSLNFLYWSLDFICLDVVPKTAEKSYTSTLNLLIDDVYTRRLKRPPCPSYPWWTTLQAKPPWPCPNTPLLALDSIVSEARAIAASPPPPPLLTASGEAVYISGVIVDYLPLWILLNLHSYSCSVWDISPHLCSKKMRQWCL